MSERMTEERLNQITAMLNTGFFPAPGNATVAQLMDYVTYLREELEEAQQMVKELQEELECFQSKTKLESLGYGAKWKRKALEAREQRDELGITNSLVEDELLSTKSELAGAQQTIALLTKHSSDARTFLNNGRVIAALEKLDEALGE